MRNFRLKIILLFLVSFAIMTALSFVIGRTEFAITQLVLFALLVLVIVQLFRMIDTTNRKISSFLTAIHYQDYTASFPQQGSDSFASLHQALNASLQKLTKRSEQQSKTENWQAELINQLPLGILVLKNDQLEFVNESLLSMLALPSLKKLAALEHSHPKLFLQLQESTPGKFQQLSLRSGDSLSLYSTKVKSSEVTFQFFFFQSIQELQNEVEMQAWMRLIRVLTHELMNSVTSISSLATSLTQISKAENLSEDVQAAAQSIEKRSKSLVQFTESYRAVSDIKAANKSWFLWSELVEEQLTFFKQELKGVSVSIQTEQEQQVYADRQQMEQVIINLLLNTIAALKQTTQPVIHFMFKQEGQTSLLILKDNGSGIPPKDQNQIFVPFFTTRKGGKGIGLSLCRQLLQNNNGRISLRKSEPGQTVFELRMNNAPIN